MGGIRRLLLAYCATCVIIAPVMVRAVPPGPPPLKDVAGNSLPSIAWTHSFNFDDGLQGWSINPGSNPVLPARWINPQVEPNGPGLPDGQPSGSSGWLGDTSSTGGGSIYLPGNNANNNYTGGSPESIAERTINSILPGTTSINSFVMQVDAYVANLLPLNGFRHDGAYPGLHLESAGFCVLNSLGTAMCLEGDGTSTSSGSGSYNGYLRFRDFTGSAGNTWQFPTCCGGKTIMELEGLWPTCDNKIDSDKASWWDQWVTLYINYNYSKAGEVYVWAYIPWTHPSPNCSLAATGSGWIEIARRPIGNESIPLQNWTKLQLSGTFSWTQGQWDNVKLALPPICHTPPFDTDADGDVDMDDFGAFQRCYTGPVSTPGSYIDGSCRCYDRYPVGAPDYAIDSHDLESFTSCLSRPGTPPPSNCTN